MLNFIKGLAREITPPVIWRTMRALKRSARPQTSHTKEIDMKIISPEVYERLALADNCASRIHQLLSRYMAQREGTFSTTGTDALTPELAAGVEKCLRALGDAENAAVNVAAHFQQETRWVCPSL